METKKFTILIVEDEHQLRTLMAVVLERAGYRVLEAAHSNEAASVWKKHFDAIDLIITDIWLPGIAGPELVGFLTREKPSVRSLYVSGLNPEIQPEFKKLTRRAEILRKPFTTQELLDAVKRALGDSEI